MQIYILYMYILTPRSTSSTTLPLLPLPPFPDLCLTLQLGFIEIIGSGLGYRKSDVSGVSFPKGTKELWVSLTTGSVDRKTTENKIKM